MFPTQPFHRTLVQFEAFLKVFIENPASRSLPEKIVTDKVIDNHLRHHHHHQHHHRNQIQHQQPHMCVGCIYEPSLILVDARAVNVRGLRHGSALRNQKTDTNSNDPSQLQPEPKWPEGVSSARSKVSRCLGPSACFGGFEFRDDFKIRLQGLA